MRKLRQHLSNRPRTIVLACLVLVAAASGWSASILATGAGTEPASAAVVTGTPQQRIGQCGSDDDPQVREACFAKVALELLEASGTPGIDELERIARVDERLGQRCHILMHTVAVTFARREKVTAANVAEYLPESAAVNCPVGLTHGLLLHALEGATTETVSGVVPACTREPSRIKQVNCIHGLGHSFMRNADSDVAAGLAMCDGLGVRYATDCAPGVFHDYFLGMVGDAGAKLPAGGGEWNPRTLCADQPARFVRACWLRAIQFGRDLEQDPVVDLASEARRECGDLTPHQREGCIAAHSFISEGAALDACFALPRTDATSCLLGMNADPIGEGVLESCGERPAAVRDLCFSWFGRLHAIFSEDQADRAFCAELASLAGRRWCVRGAARAGEPLGVL